MYALLIKEINSFFNSLIGYIAIILFLLVMSGLMWIFRGEMNVLDSGFSSLSTLFVIAPWVFSFLIPAITMRLFSDEKKAGTIELLLTKPLSEFEIILAKYFAGLLLVLFALLPTLIYYYSVYQLAMPVGNIDSGGFWGSFVGLFFLAAGFVSIGVFASSITNNQIISFIVGMFLIIMFYIGFDALGNLELFGSFDSVLTKIGIEYHYISMSRGVLDTRDMVYFLGIIIFFILLTRTVLVSRKW